MPGAPHLVHPPTAVYRVALAKSGTKFRIIDPIDAVLPSTGNRFDVPGGGTLYCCSQLGGCFRETLARLRPNPRLAHLDEGTPNHFMAAGVVPASWRDAAYLHTVP